MEQKNVLIPIDASDNSQRAFDFYLENLRQDNDYIILLHVQSTPHLSLATLDSPLSLPVDEWAAKLKDSVAESQKLIAKYEMVCEEKKMNKKTILGNGKAGEAICDAAKAHNVHMIVMGSRGQNTMRRTFLGSVSDYVLHHIHVPVTVVPPPQ